MFQSLSTTMVIIALAVCHASAAAQPVPLDVEGVHLVRRQGKWIQRVIHSGSSPSWEKADSPTVVVVRLPAGTTTLPAGLVVQPVDKWSYRLAASLAPPVMPTGIPLALEDYRGRAVVVRPDKRPDIPGRIAEVADNRLAVTQTLKDRERFHFIDVKTILNFDVIHGASVDHDSYLHFTPMPDTKPDSIRVEYELPSEAPTVTHFAELQHSKPGASCSTSLTLTNHSAHDWMHDKVMPQLLLESESFDLTVPRQIMPGTSVSATVGSLSGEAPIQWQWRFTAAGLQPSPDLVIERPIPRGLDGDIVVTDKDSAFRRMGVAPAGDSITLTNVAVLDWHTLKPSRPSKQLTAQNIAGMWLQRRERTIVNYHLHVSQPIGVPINFILGRDSKLTIEESGSHSLQITSHAHSLDDLRTVTLATLGQIERGDLHMDEWRQLQDRVAELREIENLYSMRESQQRLLDVHDQQRVLGFPGLPEAKLVLTTGAVRANTNRLFELHRRHQLLATERPEPIPRTPPPDISIARHEPGGAQGAPTDKLDDAFQLEATDADD